jgi:hypothetical protein
MGVATLQACSAATLSILGCPLGRLTAFDSKGRLGRTRIDWRGRRFVRRQRFRRSALQGHPDGEGIPRSVWRPPLFRMAISQGCRSSSDRVWISRISGARIAGGGLLGTELFPDLRAGRVCGSEWAERIGAGSRPELGARPNFYRLAPFGPVRSRYRVARPVAIASNFNKVGRRSRRPLSDLYILV